MAPREFSSDVESGNPLAGQSIRLDGETFRFEGGPSILELAELAYQAAISPDVRGMVDIAANTAVLRSALGPAEYARFRAHCAGRQTPDEVILNIIGYVNDLVEQAQQGMTGRPTVPSAGSSPGQADRDDRVSRVVSASRGEVTTIPASPVRPRSASRGRSTSTSSKVS